MFVFLTGFTMARKPVATLPEADALSVTQAAAREGVSPDTIRRRIADGTIPAHRVGPKLIRIYVADLDRLRRPIPTVGGGH